MEWIVIIGIWILFGLWCKSIAEKKNLDGNLGFLFGFLFGLISVIVYSFLSARPLTKKKK